MPSNPNIGRCVGAMCLSSFANPATASWNSFPERNLADAAPGVPERLSSTSVALCMCSQVCPKIGRWRGGSFTARFASDYAPPASDLNLAEAQVSARTRLIDLAVGELARLRPSL